MKPPHIDRFAVAPVVGLATHTSNVINTNVWSTMIAHWIKLVFPKNALILAIVLSVGVGLNVERRDTKQFAFVLLVYKEIRSYLVLKSVANLMMIVLLEKSAILL